MCGTPPSPDLTFGRHVPAGRKIGPRLAIHRALFANHPRKILMKDEQSQRIALMKLAYPLRNPFFAVASVSASIFVALAFEAAAWTTANNGLYSGDNAIEVRVGPLPSQSSGSFPQSAEVFKRTIAFLNSFRGLSFSTTWSGNTASIAVSGNVSGSAVSGTVRVVPSRPNVVGNTASIVTRVSATGSIANAAVREAINVTETIEMGSAEATLLYSSSSEFSDIFGNLFFVPSSLLNRVSLGTGTESNPFIPPNANWTLPVIIVIIPILPNRPTNFDPPNAKGFDYKVRAGRSERVQRVYAPKGFGNKIKVYAAAGRKGRPKLVGTIASGKNISLTRANGLGRGAAYVRMEGMKPRPDLSVDAPYPVGFTFTNLREAKAEIEVIPKI